MGLENSLRKLLHRKSWEMCTPAPASTAAGSFVCADKYNLVPDSLAFLCAGVSAIYRYDGDQDAWLLLPASGMAAAAAGACGEFRALSAMGGSFTQTATAGSTTTITTNRTIVRSLAGRRIRVVAGAGIGYDGTILSNTIGANAVITVSITSGVAFDATTQYQVYAGSLWIQATGATAPIWVYDLATNAWTSRANTGQTWGTDGALVSTMSSASSADAAASGTASSATSTTLVDSSKAFTTNQYAHYQIRILTGTGNGQTRTISSNDATSVTVSAAWTVTPDSTSTYEIIGAFAVGIATAGASTTLTNSTKSWATNQWANYQVRITAGTGIGQIRTIASNTGTALTVSSAWTTNPDTTSQYAIEGNDDYFYLLGNAAVTLYRFSVSANTWSGLSPTAARAGAAAAGCSANWMDGVASWTLPSNESPTQWTSSGTAMFRQNGRYIYSFRGGGVSTLDVYDIAANTWISGVSYGNQQETFTTGSCAFDHDGMIYVQKEATGRIFFLDVAENVLKSLTTNLHPQGAATVGQKMFVLPFEEGDTVDFLYTLHHTRAEMVRMILI